MPHAFYGTVSINGAPAPVGIVIEARGEGVLTGIAGNPFTTAEAGKYGSASPLDSRLVVQGDIPDGATLNFYVNGVATAQTASWHSGVVTELNLTVDVVIPGDANGDGKVNACDITKVERIIAGLDAPFPGADADLSGTINAADITKIERIIAGLP